LAPANCEPPNYITINIHSRVPTPAHPSYIRHCRLHNRSPNARPHRLIDRAHLPRTVPARVAPPPVGAYSPPRSNTTTLPITLTDTPASSRGEAAPSPPPVRPDSHSIRATLRDLNSAILDATADPESDSPYPPPFSSLYFPPDAESSDANKAVDSSPPETPPAFSALPPLQGSSSSAAAPSVVADTKAALPRDTKDPSKDFDDGEPPPPYSEGSSPLASFTYVMATAGGPASIITQVSQGGPAAPLNTLGSGMVEIELLMPGPIR
jgi:hypothetical protein